ncbi:MAG: thioredoxin family protein [Candidatus Methanomethyliaceae archaeon]|nr:thioredoxin family protein [Candidatus Methanomethyliaceae archaeon]MDW7970976.1 thioredoxin family protein [Nitrososphaerota archaeon]
MVVKVEAFTAQPPCPGCAKLLEYCDIIKSKYGDRVEVIKHMGPCEEFKKYGLTVVPAIVFNEGKIKIMGVCPSMKTIENALKEMGV